MSSKRSANGLCEGPAFGRAAKATEVLERTSDPGFRPVGKVSPELYFAVVIWSP